MNAFDQAWEVVKMARHIISDDVEFWDPFEERGASWHASKYGDKERIDDAPEGYEHLPMFREIGPIPEEYGWINREGEPKEEWTSWAASQVNPHLNERRKSLKGDGLMHEGFWEKTQSFPFDEEGNQMDRPMTFEEIEDLHRRHWEDPFNHANYYPWNAGASVGDYGAKIMMTPTDFLNLAAPSYHGDDDESIPAYQPRVDEMVEAIRRNSELGRAAGHAGGRTPWNMPFLGVELMGERPQPYQENFSPLTGPQDFQVEGHEGRHRMKALVDMGLGDQKVPVWLGLRSNSKHSFGQHQGSNPRAVNWEPHIKDSWFWPEKYRHEGEIKRHPASRPFRAREINTDYGSGQYFPREP